MIGILNAYHFDSMPCAYQEEYSRLFFDFVQKIFPDKKNEIIEYKVAQDKFPDNVFECDIWFITGSPKSVYEDIPWIHRLRMFTKELHANKRKTIGICFGHQMVAHALGGKVSKSSQGWGVGIRSFEIIKIKPWMHLAAKAETQQNLKFEKNKVALLFSHQDQVETLAPESELLARDNFCANQMSQLGEHIMTLQGHPEFTLEFAKERLISRKNIIQSETYELAMQSFVEGRDDDMMINWIRKFAAAEVDSKKTFGT